MTFNLYTNLHIRVDQSENVIFNRSANHNTLNITRVKDTCCKQTKTDDSDSDSDYNLHAYMLLY